MVKIIRYEVYSDRGEGWKLIDQFSGDERQDATFCAREIEDNGQAVKVIREIYETDDGSFQETVEYISGLKKNTKAKIVSVEDAIFEGLKGEYNVEATPFKMLAENQVSKALVKLFLIVAFSLLLANVLTGLSVPIVEYMVPDEKRKSVLFFGFFVIFVVISGPLLFYKVPWNVFYSLRKDDKEIINEKVIFRRATNLMTNYNLHDNGEEVITPVFPEASLEYKQYIIGYLTQILNNLESNIKIKESFNRLGVELIVYGGCLELAKYGRLKWAEVNSLLYEAIKVLEGNNVDLQAFYDAKRAYQDNKVAVFLTGVGSYLMSQVVRDIPMDANVLRMTMEKWMAFMNNGVEDHSEDDKKEDIITENFNIPFECLVNLRINVNIFDDEKEISSEEQASVHAEIHGWIASLKEKYCGSDVIEEGNITSVRFMDLGKAVQFTVELLPKFEEYKESQTQYNLIIDAKAAILEISSDKAVNLSNYISDVLEYAYNQEIIVNGLIKDELLESPYAFEFLGDKKLQKTEISVPLYKMSF